MLTMQSIFLSDGHMGEVSLIRALIGFVRFTLSSRYAVGGLPISIGGKKVGVVEVAGYAYKTDNYRERSLGCQSFGIGKVFPAFHLQMSYIQICYQLVN